MRLDTSKWDQRFKRKGGLVIHTFWTNFSKEKSQLGQYELLNYDPGLPGYWTFKTNLDSDFMEVNLGIEKTRGFLFKMLAIYNPGGSSGDPEGLSPLPGTNRES